MSILKIIGFSLGTALLLGQATVNADVKMYSNGATPSGDEMGKLLFPKRSSISSSVSKPRMRGISITPKDPVQPIAEVAEENQQAATIGLPIKFGYNSADILNESKPSLAELGQMLSSPDYSNERLLIEGHTDSKGSDQYNQYLSEKRAESVKKYLRENFNIASNRLFITGMGESQPLENIKSSSSANRRVQFRRAP